VALLMIRVPARSLERRQRADVWGQFKEGWEYAFGSAPIRALLTLLAIVSLAGVPYTILMPVFARDILGGGPHTLGFLMGASACGALIGAFWLAGRRSATRLGHVVPFSAGVFGVGLMAFAASRSLGWSIAALVVAGFGFMMQAALSNTLLQSMVADEKRGRVLGFFMMAFLGTAPIGSLAAGLLAARIGGPGTVAIGGLCCLAVSLWFVRQLPSFQRALGVEIDSRDGGGESDEIGLAALEGE
jgi:MFS family permease